MIRLTLYTKPDCCLCEEALEVIERVRHEIPLDLEEVDVSSDRDLVDRYGEAVPVVLIDGAAAFEFHVDERALRDRLMKLTGRRTTNGTTGVAR